METTETLDNPNGLPGPEDGEQSGEQVPATDAADVRDCSQSKDAKNISTTAESSLVPTPQNMEGPSPSPKKTTSQTFRRQLDVSPLRSRMPRHLAAYTHERLTRMPGPSQRPKHGRLSIDSGDRKHNSLEKETPHPRKGGLAKGRVSAPPDLERHIETLPSMNAVASPNHVRNQSPSRKKPSNHEGSQSEKEWLKVKGGLPRIHGITQNQSYKKAGKHNSKQQRSCRKDTATSDPRVVDDETIAEGHHQASVSTDEQANMDEVSNSDRASTVLESFCAKFGNMEHFRKLQSFGSWHDRSFSASDVPKDILDSMIQFLESEMVVPQAISASSLCRALAAETPTPVSDVEVSSGQEKDQHQVTHRRVTFGATAEPKISGSIDDTEAEPISRMDPDIRQEQFNTYQTLIEIVGKHADAKELAALFASNVVWISDELGGTQSLEDLAMRDDLKAPGTPWTQKHAYAAVRPRTSLRSLMLEQDRMRIDHFTKVKTKSKQHDLRNKRRLERMQAEMSWKQQKEERKKRWREAIQEVERLCNDMLKEEKETMESENEQGVRFMIVIDQVQEKHRQNFPPAYDRLPLIEQSKSLSKKLGFDGRRF